MYMPLEMARERMRDHLEQAEELQVSRQIQALSRARRAELRAERRLVEAWRTRAALEAR